MNNVKFDDQLRGAAEKCPVVNELPSAEFAPKGDNVIQNGTHGNFFFACPIKMGSVGVEDSWVEDWKLSLPLLKRKKRSLL